MPEAPVHAPHGPLPEGGTVRPMTRWGDPVMHRVQQPVTSYDEELRSLVADMVATMYAADGVGLAACQIGVDRAVFVFDCPDASGEHTVGVVCNPELTLPEVGERQLDDDDEGCLSLPGAFVALRATRPRHRSPAPAWTASRSPSAATGCWPAASSTRPTTCAAPSSATGWRPSCARSCRSSTTGPPRSSRRAGRPSHRPRVPPRTAPGRRSPGGRPRPARRVISWWPASREAASKSNHPWNGPALGNSSVTGRPSTSRRSLASFIVQPQLSMSPSKSELVTARLGLLVGLLALGATPGVGLHDVDEAGLVRLEGHLLGPGHRLHPRAKCHSVPPVDACAWTGTPATVATYSTGRVKITAPKPTSPALPRTWTEDSSWHSCGDRAARQVEAAGDGVRDAVGQHDAHRGGVALGRPAPGRSA